MKASIDAQIKESILAKSTLLANESLKLQIESCVYHISTAFRNDHKLLIAGNGGSAADSQHFAAELSCRFKKDRPALPAIALTTDTSALTAWSNDYEFNSFFARMVSAYGQRGDIFFAITTSGNSSNLVEAAKVAKAKGLYVVCLTGRNGGEIRHHADLCLVCPGESTCRIQEVHQLIYHIICQEIENLLFP